MYVAGYACMSSSIVNILRFKVMLIPLSTIFFKNSTLNSAVVGMCSTVINIQECWPI